jgi:hypothetical protein
MPPPPPKPGDVERIRAITAIKRERRCSFDEAVRIHDQQRLEGWQEASDSFFAGVAEAARTFEEIANSLPERKRETFLDLPLGAAVAMAVRHFAPRQRGRCERRPRARAVRRRSGRATRAGPGDDPPQPEHIAASRRPTERGRRRGAA